MNSRFRPLVRSVVVVAGLAALALAADAGEVIRFRPGRAAPHVGLVEQREGGYWDAHAARAASAWSAPDELAYDDCARGSDTRARRGDYVDLGRGELGR